MSFGRLTVLVGVIVLLTVYACAEHGVFPRPGEEVWELISETGVYRSGYSDRCCAIDGRGRLYVCETGGADSSQAACIRRWDGREWCEIHPPDAVWSLCSGPENIVLLGEQLNLGYIQDDEYHEIEMGYFYSDWQFTTCFEDDTWVLSSGPEDGLQRTNWREGGGDWLDTPSWRIVYEIDAWGPSYRWATCAGELYYQENGGSWQALEVETSPMESVWIEQVEPCGQAAAWAIGNGDLYHFVDGGLHNVVDEGAPLPNGPVQRIAIDRFEQPWCALGNGQIARFNGYRWTHYTCPFVIGRVQDMTFDQFENLYVITDRKIVMMRNDWHCIELDFSPANDSYAPGAPVGINAVVANSSWYCILADLYIAFRNKATGEWLFLPGPTEQIRPALEGLCVPKRAIYYMGYIQIGPAPHTPGRYETVIGFTPEGRLDAVCSNIATADILVSNPD